ncbi:MAG TPA: hypothetical protein VND93_05585 [Myxococcales bacterium]|nr:hypothetical protein [Myxococcales bacterium]
MGRDDRRRRSRAGRWLLAGASLLLCSGCFDVVEEIWLEAGGGGRLRLEISLPKSLLSMGRLGGEDLLVSVREDAANAKAELARDPDIRRFDYRTEEKPGVFNLVYEVEANDAAKLQAAQARALSVLASRAGKGRGGMRQSPVDFSVARRFGLGFDFQGALGGGSEKEDGKADPGDDIGKAMAGAMLGGHAITVRLHAPFILSTNGAMDPTRTTAEWKVPLTALMEPGFKQELTAQALAVDWKVGAAGAVVALLLLGTLFGRLTARRR